MDASPEIPVAEAHVAFANESGAACEVMFVDAAVTPGSDGLGLSPSLARSFREPFAMLHDSTPLYWRPVICAYSLRQYTDSRLEWRMNDRTSFVPAGLGPCCGCFVK